MTELIRSFVAISLSTEIRNQLKHFYEINKLQSYNSLRTVKPELIHITLKFLGNTSLTTLEKVKQVLTIIASRTASFPISFRGLGAFPGWHNPRVIWIGVEAPTVMADLEQSIELESLKLGFQPEARGFNPHLTIARINQQPGLSLSELQALKALPQPNLGKMMVSEISLFRSDLRPSGPLYTSLSTHILASPEV